MNLPQNTLPGIEHTYLMFLAVSEVLFHECLSEA